MTKKTEINQLKKEISLQNKKLEHIFNICRKSVNIIHSQKPEKLNSLLQVIINETTSLLDSEIGSILLLEPPSNILTIRVAKGLSKNIVEETKIKTGEKISGWVVEHKKGLLVSDIEKDSRFARRNQEKYYTKSFVTAPIRINKSVLGVINVNNKRSRQPYKQEDLDLLQTMAIHAALLISSINQYKELQKLYINTVEALAEAIDARDHYTKKHSEHVTEYAVAIARQMNLPPKRVEFVEKAARLHDIGKIGIHDYILTKPGKLTPQEWEEVKGHSLKGVRILGPLGFLDNIINAIGQHHERYDGTGYPDGRKGTEISLEARIMAVADAFDAMTTQRPYAKALNRRQAVEELKRESGRQFDPAVVKAFLKIIEKKESRLVRKKLVKVGV